MKRINLLLLLCLYTSMVAFAKVQPQPKAKKAKWVQLFNGKNLEGWQPKIVGYPFGENAYHTFRVENGILSTRYDQYKSFDNQFGALYFKQKYANFRLKVTYRFVGETALGAPSWGFRDGGIQYYCQDPNSVEKMQHFPVCLEYNLHGGNGKDDRPVGEICANGIYVTVEGEKNKSYCTPATVKRTFHGDQWITLEIDVKEGKMAHFINGEKILSYQNPRFDATHALGKTFIVDGNDAVTNGYISIQSNSHPMDFKSIEIMTYK
jgi:Domain of Unknown Function (DUF1080)